LLSLLYNKKIRIKVNFKNHGPFKSIFLIKLINWKNENKNRKQLFIFIYVFWLKLLYVWHISILKILIWRLRYLEKLLLLGHHQSKDEEY
jgi:hypothetical protein